MKIVLASGNKHKIAEFQAILKRHIPDAEVISMKEVGITDDIVEDGSSFEENAMIKAKAVASHGYIGVGDDSGLAADALDGAPGIYSARYAGVHGDDSANNEKLLADLADKADRSASFVCAIACAMPDGESFCVRGDVRGKILHELKGQGGFGYDPLFYVEEYGKTFAELSADEKNKISHRAVASELFVKKLCEIMNK